MRFVAKIIVVAALFLGAGLVASGAEDKVNVTAAVRSNMLEVVFNIPQGQHVALQKDFLFVNPQPVAGRAFGETIYPETAMSKDGQAVYSGSVTLSREIRILSAFDKNAKLTVTAGWQSCLDSGTCLMPETVDMTVELPAFAVTPGGVADGSGTALPGRVEHGLLYFIMLAFIGGIILNFMPCVLPVLSIKLLNVMGSSHDDAKVVRRGAMAYTAGVLISFLVLAVIVIVAKSFGEMAGWGFQFQNPVFVTVLLAVIWIFALSLFDVFIINLPGMNRAADASAKSGMAGSFFSGMFAVLLATPCTAPMLGAALGFAFSQPSSVIIIMFLVVGLGLAFPFLVAGFVPGVTRFIPKPGNWMATFREMMGFLLLATCVYLLHVLKALLGGKIYGVWWYLLLLSFLCWAYGRFVSRINTSVGQWAFALAVMALAIGGWVGLVDLKSDSRTSSVGASAVPGWERFSAGRIAELQKEGKPIFIDFGAEWCLTCKMNEHGVLYTKEVQDAFQARGCVLVRGDYTRKDPEITAWLKKFKRAGVPLYVYYPPGSSVPYVFPEIITKKMILDQIGAPGGASSPRGVSR